MVGRVAELAELELALRQAASGRPALVLVSGESGIGKTRLLAEFQRRIEDDSGGPLVLRGEAVETGDGELPYGPLLGALRPLVRERHAVLDELAPDSRAQLGALLPGLQDGERRADGNDPSAQLRLFEALLELLHRLSAHQPVVLVLEDMHWADRSTRAFVTFLARSVRRERVLIVVTYRSDELHRRHPLRPLLAELDRIEHTRRLELVPLDRDELSAALGDILGRPADAGLVDRLYVRAEGNPLFTEELLAASLDGRGAAPQNLRDAFMLRIERLSPEAQRAARVIAVGRSLTEALIAELCGLDHERLHEALREAVAAQVLVPGGDENLLFRHELLREAMYEDLLPGERSELHLALARALEQRAAGGEEGGMAVVASIAAHYAAGGDQPAALRATVSAARAARAAHATEEAARLAERGLELWPRVSEPERVAGIAELDLRLLAARAQLEAGASTRAEHLLRAALDQLDAQSEPRDYACVLALLARTQWSLNRGQEGVRTAQRALMLLPEADGGPERRDLLGWLARTELLRGRFRDAARDGEAAHAAALAAGDRGGEAHALTTMGMARVSLGDVEGGTELLRRAIAVYEASGDLPGAATARSNLADMLAVAGHTQEALATAREGLKAVSRHLRSSYQWMELTLSEQAYLAGDWALARRHLGPAPEELVGRQLIFRLLREADLALGEGDEETAAARLEQAEPLVASALEPQWIGGFGALAAELHRRRGDLAAARAQVAHALDCIEVCSDDVIRIARVSAAGLRVEADIAQRARDLRETGEQRQALARARLHHQRLRAAAAEGGPVEAAWLATGAAELARARGRNDAALWSKAAAKWEEIERPYEAALMRFRAGEAAALGGDRALATEHARAALGLARDLGSRWLEQELLVLAQRARLRLDDRDEPADANGNAAQPEDPFGLTERERDVLALIAQGATNRQIGAALFMAEKTASVHVSRILAKLGVHSRTEAAAVAHRVGWLIGDRATAKPR
jgi:ATP/maltotriose-dependent transcriptional regulator MalT